MNAQKRFFDRLAEKLHIKSLEDWYNISQSDIIKNGGSGILMKFYGGSPLRALKAIYPDYNWTDKNSLASELKGQNRLFAVLQNIYPMSEIHMNYMHSEIVNPETGRGLELDFFIPEQNVAFEYQGKQHLETIPFYGDSIELKKTDLFKKEACKRLGISLVEVHQSWNGTEANLVQIISQKNKT